MLDKIKPAGKKSEAGFSLIEMIVALTIFLLAVAVIFEIARLANIQRSTVVARTDQMRGARVALEYIRRDAVNAGFGYNRTGGNAPDNIGSSLFGIPADGDTERDLLTAILAGNNINTNPFSPNKTDVVSFISRDSVFNSNKVLPYTGTQVSGTRVDVVMASGTASVCQRFDVYLFESASGTTQVLGMAMSINNGNTIRLNTGDPLGLNQSATASGNNQNLLALETGGGSIKKVNVVSYSVDGNGVLIRKEYGNQTGKAFDEQIESRELVMGVSDFQIRYFMSDGTIIDDPSSGNNGRTNQIKMNNVVQIEVSITLLPDETHRKDKISAPITIKEFISAKNLRYEAS